MSTVLSTTIGIVRPLHLRSRVRALSPGAAVVVRVPERLAAVVVGTAIALLLAAGVAVAAAALLGRDHLLGLSALFNLNGERNLPAWFSSALLLSCAALLMVAAGGARERFRGRWVLLASVFFLLSLDETASLHELTNAPLRAALAAGSWFYFPWVAFGVTLAAAVALVERPLLHSLPAATRRAFVLAGATFVGGAAGLEMLAAPIYATSGKTSWLHAALVAAEEGLEMAGVAIFLLALLHYVNCVQRPLVLTLDDREGPLTKALRLSPRRMTNVMVMALVAIAGANLAAQAVHYLAGADIPLVVRLLNVSREGNIPTWYQSTMLFGCAAATATIAISARRTASPWQMHWVLLALAFVYLSADEAAAIHELSVKPLRAAFATSGLLYYPWVVLGAAAVAAVTVASRRFIAALPQPTRYALLRGAATFLAGALVVEAFSGAFAETYGRDNFGYGLVTTLEETLEMLGVTFVMRGLLEHIRDHVGLIVVGNASRTAAATAAR